MTSLPIIIIQGAWGSSASWSPVADLLRQTGYRVLVPSLSGLGERQHMPLGGINIDSHVKDVLSVLKSENISQFILVAHSYGGMVASALAEHVKDRIAAVVLLDAFLPLNGEAVFDLVDAKIRDANIKDAGALGGTGVPPPARHSPRVPEKFQHYLTSRSPHPLASMVQRVELTGALQSVPRRTYISAIIDQGSIFVHATQRALEQGWTVKSVETGHMLHLEAPQQIADIIYETSRRL